MNTRLTAALLVATAIIPVSVNAQRAPLQRATIGQLDVAGVRLGMSPAEARAALLKSGFVLAPFVDKRPSWEQRVQNAVVQRQSNSSYRAGVREIAEPVAYAANGSRKQEIQVLFASVPGGARVKKIIYHIPLDQITKADFDANVRAKYGAPQGYPKTLLSVGARWCSDGEPTCSNNGSLQKPNLLAATSQGNLRHSIVLDGVNVVEEARLKALFAAEVERRAPRTRETAF